VTLNASDNLAGVAGTFYSVDGGPAQTYTTTFSVAGEGVHTVEFWSVDVADNTEATHSLVIKIDTINPLVTAAANPTTAAKSPRPVTVTISGNVTDGLSGVSSVNHVVIDEYGVTQPSGAVTLKANGNYSFTLTLPATKNGPDKNGHLYTILVTATDQAGNSASATATLTIN